MSIPQQPKYLRISQLLETEIQSGRWQNARLPSMREIAEEYSVSVVTASRALQCLRDKRLINTVDRSGSYRIQPTDVAQEIWALHMNVTPGSWTSTIGTQYGSVFASIAQQQHGTVLGDCFENRVDASEREFVRMARAACERGVQGVYLLPARISEQVAIQDEWLIDACKQVGLPVVLIDRNLRGHERVLECDLVCNDDYQGMVDCTRHLLAQGRKRVACVVGSPTSSHDARIAAYLYALYRYSNGRKLEPLVYLQSSEESARRSYQLLADDLLAADVDGVVCYQDYAAMGLIMEFLHREVRVPRDVAVTGFEDLPIGNSFAVGITTYSYNLDEIARHALRVMRERLRCPTEPPVKILVPGKFIVRDSSQSANKGR